MDTFKPCGLGMEPMQVPGPPRAPGYKGEKRWIVRLEDQGAIMIYAPSHASAIVHAAAHFGHRWQDQDYILGASAWPTKQK